MVCPWLESGGLQNTLSKFDKDVGTIPCGYGASTSEIEHQVLQLSDAGFHPMFQIWAIMCYGNIITGAHLPVRSLLMMSTPFYLFDRDVGTIPCVYGASIIEVDHQVELRQQARISSDFPNLD